MWKTLISCCICATMVLGDNMEKNDIKQYICDSSRVQVIINGEYKEVKNINELNFVLNNMLNDSHVLPALGVSIHHETLVAMQTGVWLKLQYNGTQAVDDMPFDELLIEVNPDFNGFNIIRGNRGIYEGRCYYIDLVTTNMSELYDCVIKLK
ncbi:MAG: hypothetical protein IJA72_02770 [Clostridia bacterium]|nr:hypothetical protein [Clostridia bacterium]